MKVGPPQKAHCATTKIQISQLWDFIETWDFREDLKPIVFSRLSGGPFHVIEAGSINGFRMREVVVLNVSKAKIKCNEQK